MFIYENGLPVDYIVSDYCNPEVADDVRAEMLRWIRTLSGQSRVRMGKVGLMQGSAVDLKRMEHE